MPTHYTWAWLLSILGAVGALESSEASDHLQRDLVTDLSELKMSPRVPSLFGLTQAKGQPLRGRLIQEKFTSVDQLKAIQPVQLVRGQIIGRPFTLQEAARAAGIDVIRRIWGKKALPRKRQEAAFRSLNLAPTDMTSQSGDDDTLASGDVEKEALSPRGFFYKGPHEMSKPLEGVLIPRLHPADGRPMEGQPLAAPFWDRSQEWLQTVSVNKPVEVLYRAKSMPGTVLGRVIAGDLTQVHLISDDVVKDLTLRDPGFENSRFGAEVLDGQPDQPEFPMRKDRDQPFDQPRERKRKFLDLSEEKPVSVESGSEEEKFLPGEDQMIRKKNLAQMLRQRRLKQFIHSSAQR